MAIPLIDEWAGSRFGFYVDRHWLGRWVQEPGPIRLAEYHARILRHCFTPDSDGRLLYDTVCLAEPAKSGKSALAGLVGQYFALHIEPGSEVYMISNKQDQAQSRMFKSLTDSLRLNPHLRIKPNRYEVTFRSGTMVKAIPSNARTEAGARYSLACFDEPWAIIYEDGERLVSEFKTDPTRTASVKLFTGYAGYTESKLWLDLLNSGLAGEPVPELADIVNDDGEPACWRNDRTFVFWSHVCRQPWQTSAWIESQRKALRPNEFLRMIEARFAEGEGDFVDFAAWESCIDPNHKPLAPGDKRFPVYVGLDLALAPGGDDCAVIGVYPEGSKVKVAFHRVWKGGKARKHELKLSQTVEPFLLQAKRDYRIVGVYFDPYQCKSTADNLRRAGLNCVVIEQTHSTRGPLDTALFEMIVNRELIMYPDDDLRQCAKNANAKELGNGLIFLTKAGRGKIDLLAALSNCASQARRGANQTYVGLMVFRGRWNDYPSMTYYPVDTGAHQVKSIDDVPSESSYSYVMAHGTPEAKRDMQARWDAAHAPHADKGKLRGGSL